ncbi:MAG: asparagine synthase (glutamine-hydrolyzing), partial [Haloarculaceae archaeon]
MCGIAGVFGADASTDTLERMSDCLVHRGPDDAGVYRDDPAGLAHRRLSIIDVEGGDQPQFNESDSVALVYNGEIYNYQRLREELRSAGHDFSTDSDTEVIIHGYEEYGVDVLERIEGMFAFALWDRDRERFFLARDRLGIKPLVLARTDGQVAFASETAALLDGPVDLGGLDDTAVAQYFAFGFVPAPRSIFENARKLQPGEYALVSDAGVRYDQYYRPSVASRSPSLEAAASELRGRVERSIEDRLMADVPLGAFLSGGIDSSVVVGTMANLREEPVRTFTVGFEEERFDETWAARTVAEYHDTDHHEYTVSADDVRELIPDVLGRLGEPFADQSLVPTTVVADRTSDSVKVALSGDGADELFAGYDKYRGEYFSRYYRAFPRPFRQRVVEPLVESLPADRTTATGERIRKVRKFLRGGEPDPVRRHYEWLRIPGGSAGDALAVDADAAGIERVGEAHEDVREWLPTDRQDALGLMGAADTAFVLPNQMLTKVDQASMANSLEVRVPFLDTAVVEYAMSLPTEHKITARDSKRVLKRAFEDVLPPEILERDKQGFDMPIGAWFRTALHDEFRSL